MNRLLGPRNRALAFGIAGLVVAALAMSWSALAVASAPVWDVKTRWGDTNLVPGGKGLFLVRVKNIGDAETTGAYTVTVKLPPGVTRIPPKPLDAVLQPGNILSAGGVGIESDPWTCSSSVAAGTTTVSCSSSEVQGPRELSFQRVRTVAKRLFIRVAVPTSASGSGGVTTTVGGGGALQPASDVDQIRFDAQPAPFGFVADSAKLDVFGGQYPAGAPVRRAGSHPFELRVGFDLNSHLVEIPSSQPTLTSSRLYMAPTEFLRTVETTLPRGMIGNPEATPKCKSDDFLVDYGGIAQRATNCSPATQVGVLNAELEDQGSSPFLLGTFTDVPVYNLEPPRGVPADFGFVIGPYRGHIYPSLDPTQGYAIKATVSVISSLMQPRETEFTMWGVPADPAHDIFRFDPSRETYGAEAGTAPRSLLGLPTDCEGSGHFRITAESWQDPGDWTPVETSPEEPIQVVGCNDPRFRFEPEISLQPTSRSAGGPTGLDVHLEVPQRDQLVDDVEKLYPQSGNLHAIDTPPMKKAVITFPEGMTLSTSAAQGLSVCTAAEIGIGTNSPVRCPESSRYGALTLHTPILPKDEPMVGDIFIAKKGDNPFNNFLSMYFVIHDEDRGLLVKIPGKVDLDPRTGQIRTTFDDLPQFPVSNMQLSLKGGVRAALVNPTTCGTKTIKAEFFSWHDPSTPHLVSNNYEITQKPNGSPCVNNLGERPFNPEFSAGTVNNNAGSYSPFVFRLQRSDDDQEFSQLSTTLPPGLLANISKISECPEAGIALAESKGRTGTAEQLFPSCPASSLIGTTDVGSGVGQVITYIPGKAYLAGPYKGAPLSMVVITPILAGPYDLGVIAVRSAIHVDGARGQATIQTDPFPQIYEGIPVRIRDIRVKTDRPETTINPTNCDPMAVSANVTGTGGNLDSTADDTAVELRERFQAANCASLPFKPKLSFKLKGGTKRGDFPALQAILRARPGDANIARSTVVLPRSEFIEQGHIRTVCTRVQFAANQCPPGSIYGKASAKSPLFDEVLSGPVYLRSNGGERLLPDLVVSLNGKIDVTLAGFIDSVKGRVRNTFDVIPDAPVTFFKLSMQGGKRGLLVNHLDLCEVTSRAEVRFVAQNGKEASSRPAMGTSCPKAARKKQGRAGR